MDRAKWFFHPILVFILSLAALGTSLILYIYWYIEVSAGLKSVVEKFNLDEGQILTVQTWVVILVLSILVAVILLGMLLIFVYSHKIVQLYRMQHNFINNFTHELKTPVASLRLYLETFQKYALQREDQLKYIDFMLADTQRLSDTITRILNLARIESKSYPGEFSLQDPVDLIHRLMEKNRHFFSNCRVQVHTPPGESFFCRLNPALFDILLMNLMTNAIKYNAANQPAVDIRVRLNKARLQIQFEDNGIGIDQRECKKIFKKFYQIGRAEDMTAKGTGIGLYMVQSIARSHGGSVTASSGGSGQGAVFTLSLPLVEKRGA
ncbi:MAG: sensor histidine kinase [Desulfobacteraceae bacterium]|nr:MAG: sensor histidine kinase [Desulfobacteraceae bacterium]